MVGAVNLHRTRLRLFKPNKYGLSGRETIKITLLVTFALALPKPAVTSPAQQR